MIIKLTQKQHNLLKKITAGTAFEQAELSFPIGVDFDADDDLLDRLRELGTQVEIDSVQEGGGIIRDDDEDGKIAMELVELLFTG